MYISVKCVVMSDFRRKYLPVGIFFFVFFLAHAAQGQLALEHENSFYACGSEGNYSIKVTQASKGDYTGYKIEWGDNSSQEYKGQKNMEHVYAQAGEYTLKFYGKTGTGWSAPVEYTVHAENSDIKITLVGATTGAKCKGTEMELKLADLKNNSTTTLYRVNYGDNKEWKEYTVDDLTGKDVLLLKHIYTAPSCEATNSGYMISLEVTNVCKTISTPTYGPYRIADKLTLSLDLPGKRCTGEEIYLDEITSVQPAVCGNMPIVMSWTCNGKNVEGGYLYFEEAGNYIITASATMEGLDCGNDNATKTIQIIERVKAEVTPSQTEVCTGKQLLLDGSASTGGEKKFQWKVIEGNALKVDFLPDATSEQVQAVFHEPGDYKIRMDVYNSCSTDEQVVDVHVKKDPEVRKLQEVDPLCPEGSKGGNGILVMNSNLVGYVWYNNSPGATWNVNGPAGGWSWEEGSGKNSLYPVIRFSKAGTYVLTVEIEDAGCGAPAGQLQQSWTVTVDDPGLIPDVEVAGQVKDVCEGEEVRFENHTTAAQQEALNYEWTILKNGFPAQGGIDYQFATGSDEHSAAPVLKFLTYGEYTVKVEIAVHCNREELSFDFHVKKDPEIVRFDALSVACDPYVLLFRGQIVYEWYNDTDRRLTWTVDGPAGGWNFQSGTGVNSLLPEMKFTQAGEYNLKVTLEGVGCQGNKLEASQVLKILDPALDKDIKIKNGRSIICEGETVAFENHTQSEIPVEYTWVIESDNGATEGDGYLFTSATAAHSEEPEITFTRYGNYRVIARLTTDCNRKTVPAEERFNITVQRDPEVYLREIGGICPGDVLVLDASRVEYRWNNNSELVEWIVEPADAHTPSEGIVYSSGDLYPAIQFTYPGNYRVRAILLDRAGCNGTAQEAERIIHVYDPAINLDITPAERMVREGEVFAFENHSSAAETPEYLWSVIPAEGWEWVGAATDIAPEIRFLRYGQYTVKVVMTSKGGCNGDDKEMSVEVKGIPEYHLPAEVGTLCAGGELSLDTVLSYEAKGAAIVPRWTITPGTEGVDYEFLNIGKGEVIQPWIRFLKEGSYTLTLTANAEYGGEQVISTQLEVLNPLVEAVSLSDLRGCTKEGQLLEVELENHSRGDALEYVWEVLPGTGWELTGDASDRQPVLRIQQPGDYTVKLKVKNICASDATDFNIHAFTNPEIGTIGDIRDVCDKFYVFKGKENVEIDTNGGELEWVNWTISPEGYKYAEGYAATDLYPEVSFIGGEIPYRMKLEIKNGCGDVVSREFSVLVDKYRKITPFRDTAVCSLSGDYPLKAEPDGGVWYCPDHSLVHDDWTGNYFFTPEEESERTYRLYYTYGHKSCTAVDSMELTVHPLPVVNVAEKNADACVNWEEKILQPGQPAGGEWRLEGNPLTSFDPAVYGEGEYHLKYWYTDPLTKCTNSDTLKIVVHPLPDASFGVSGEQCRNIDSLYIPVALGSGHHFEWDFGNGSRLTTEDQPAVYRYAAVGDYTVSLQATSVHQCKSEFFTRTVKVLDLPPAAKFTVKDTAGCGPFTAQAQVSSTDFEHPQGDYYQLSYLWEYGNGEESRGLEPLPQTYPATLFDTTYQMVFHVSNVCGEKTDTALIGVWSSAVAHFTMNPDPNSSQGFCTPVTPVFINGSTGSGNVYIWDFAGLAISHAVDTVFTFTTGVAPTEFTVTLKAVNRCNLQGSFDSRTFKVKPNPIIAGFTMSHKYVCAGDTVCFTNNSVDREADGDALLSYKWDFGDGQISDVWDTCHSYSGAGAYPVTLSLDNGCARQSFTDSVFVHVTPVIHIEGDSAICEDIGLSLQMVSDEPLKNIVWDFGDGTATEQGTFTIKHIFEEPGKYIVRVKGEADQIPACAGKAEKQVGIWSKPRVRIVPLDTMACPPFDYTPDITRTGYDYFTWDYGDGSPETSELSHEFLNDSDKVVSYSTTVKVINNFGCEEEHHGLIRVYDGPKAAWNKEIAYGRPEKVKFVNLSQHFTDAVWYLPDGQVVHSPLDQTLTFTEEGVYPLSLAVTNQYGCRDSVYSEHRSYEGGLYFPNTFIPHSKNPLVNRFNGIGMGLKVYKLEIFDTYGNKVWETTALEDGMPSEGWDGRNSRGHELPQGVYIWRAEAIFFSEDVWTGDNNRSGNRQSTQGSVLLLRE